MKSGESVMKENDIMSDDLFTRDDYLVIKNIFQQLVDNQIDEEDFNRLLTDNHIYLPSTFFSMPLERKKKYIQLEMIWVDPKTLDQDVQFVWNANYFYEIARKAKKSQTATTWLMEYCRYLDCRPIYFLTMQNIKIKNISYFKTYHPEVLTYAKKKRISSLYDVFMDVYHNENCKKIQAEVLSFFEKESSELFFRIDYFPNMLAIEFEQLMYSLKDQKLANEIRILFLIYKKEYFENKNFHISSFLMKKFLQDVGYKSLTRFLKFAKQHQKDIDRMPPNGYQAFYYSLLLQKENRL